MTTTKENPAVIVIGTGMTGILAAIKLRQAGIANVRILEAADSVGGTWHANTYPGRSLRLSLPHVCLRRRTQPRLEHDDAPGP